MTSPIRGYVTRSQTSAEHDPMTQDQSADKSDSPVWSGSDFPYVCLKDRGRTLELMAAVTDLVRPGDVVLDLGSGSGILSLAAARAGASEVIAVELDSLMARTLRQTVSANGYEDIITVVNTDARTLQDLEPDLVLAELIDTGLMDEPLVPVMNHLTESGVVNEHTRLLFAGYTTTLTLVEADHDYYGFKILAPKHEWPYYETDAAGSGWWKTAWRSSGEPVTAGTWRFGAEVIEPLVERRLDVPTGSVNSLLIEGSMHLGTGAELGSFNSLNAPKLLPIDSALLESGQLLVSYVMGGGLQSLAIRDAREDAIIDLRSSPTTDAQSAIDELHGA